MRNKTLAEVWDQQESYNEKIKNTQPRTRAEWMSNYILGVMGELGELLDQIRWKAHRSTTSLEFGPNVGEEMADITKYVMSMWQLLGFTEQDMLNMIYQKGEILEQLLRQENKVPLVGQSIVMLDLDGVIADFRSGFKSWLKGSKWSDSLEMGDMQIGLHLDINNGWNYQKYEEAKLAFEEDGGYNLLPPIARTMKAVNILSSMGWYIIVYTARPYKAYRRIWKDTWAWLADNRLRVDELHFGYAERVLAAEKLCSKNIVIAIEDDPTLIQRYSGSNIPVFVVPQPYNVDIAESERIVPLIDEMSALDIATFIHELVFAPSTKGVPL